MNNPTLIPSVIALLVLSLLALLLVKKGKIGRLSALLLVIIPLVVGNGVWLGWIHPQQKQHQQQQQLQQQQQRQADKIADAQQQLAATPPYSTIRQQQPALYKQINEQLVAAVRAGTDPDKAIGQLRPMVAELLNQRVGRADDDSIINYMRLSVSQMENLRQQNGELCFKFLFPQIRGGVNSEELLPQTLLQQDRQQMDALLRASQGAEKPIDIAQARRSLQSIVRKLYAKWGSDLQLLNSPTDSRVEPEKMCDMTIDLYSAVLALPTKQSANVLRMMLSTNAG